MRLQVASASIILSDTTTAGQQMRVASCDLEQLITKARLSPNTTHAEVTLQELTMLDLTQALDSSADAVLTRWQQLGEHLYATVQQHHLPHTSLR